MCCKVMFLCVFVFNSKMASPKRACNEVEGYIHDVYCSRVREARGILLLYFRKPTKTVGLLCSTPKNTTFFSVQREIGE